MAGFKIGDKVRLRRGYGDSIRVGDTAVVVEHEAGPAGTVPIKFDDPRGIYAQYPQSNATFNCYIPGSDLELVEAAPTAEETMVPMSRVREVATRYAQANGWCGEVDRALAEIQTPENDELVEVTYTATRKVTLKRKDLGKLRTPDEMKRLYSGVEGQMFASQLAPRDAKVEDNVWSHTEPVAAKSESDAGWTNFGGFRRPGGIPAAGRRVRVRSGVVAVSMGGARFSGGRIGRVVHDNALLAGQVAVRFEDDTNNGIRYMNAEDLQVHPS